MNNLAISCSIFKKSCFSDKDLQSLYEVLTCLVRANDIHIILGDFNINAQ